MPENLTIRLKIVGSGPRPGRGSAFPIGKNQILTCAHVVFGVEDIEVFRDDLIKKIGKAPQVDDFKEYLKSSIKNIEAFNSLGEAMGDVKLLKFSIKHDLAILKLDTGITTIPKLNTTEPQAEDKVSVYGYPDEVLEKDVVTFPLRDQQSNIIRSDNQYIMMEKTCAPGFSGGPILDESGSIVALVGGNLEEELPNGTTIPKYGYAIPIKSLEEADFIAL